MQNLKDERSSFLEEKKTKSIVFTFHSRWSMTGNSFRKLFSKEGTLLHRNAFIQGWHAYIFVFNTYRKLGTVQFVCCWDHFWNWTHLSSLRVDWRWPSKTKSRGWNYLELKLIHLPLLHIFLGQLTPLLAELVVEGKLTAAKALKNRFEVEETIVGGVTCIRLGMAL